MANFKPYDYNQTSMVVINFEDQIQNGTFEHALHYLISHRVNLDAFYEKYDNDHGGKPAYDPTILLKIILFAYSKGITSSREIMWNCENNIIFKALSCDSVPHWTTIANFVSAHPDAIENLFEEILLICHEQGLLGNELFAIDGCKMSSDASKEWSGSFKELEQKKKKIRDNLQHCIKEHQQLDKLKKNEEARAIRLEQTIETLDKAHEKIDRFLKQAEPRMGTAKKQKEVKSNITDNESAKMTTSKGTIQGYNGLAAVDKKHQIIIDAQAFGSSAEHHTLKPILESINTRYRDLGISQNILADQVVVTADTGFANAENYIYLKSSGVNAYIPDLHFRIRDPRFSKQKDKYGKRHQKEKVGVKSVIPSSEFHLDTKNKTCRCPADKEMWLRHDKVDESGKRKLAFEGKLTDCRSCDLKDRCLRNPNSADERTGQGRQVSFTINRADSAVEWMKARVDSLQGKVVYGHRMSVVEPVFGNIGTNKRLNRFSLRGKEKVQGQWRLFCLVHNIEKLMRYGALEKAVL